MREIAFILGERKGKLKTAKQMERHLKGVSNHRRIQILLELDRGGEMTLDQITGILECHMTTSSEHTSKLVRAGLVKKTYKGRNVMHELLPYGKQLVKFLKRFRAQ